jgi:hypothetical protein
LGWPSSILTNYGEHKIRLVVNPKIRHDLKHPGLVDLIITKQNNLPSFIDKWFLFIYDDLMFEFFVCIFLSFLALIILSKFELLYNPKTCLNCGIILLIGMLHVYIDKIMMFLVLGLF